MSQSLWLIDQKINKQTREKKRLQIKISTRKCRQIKKKQTQKNFQPRRDKNVRLLFLSVLI